MLRRSSGYAYWAREQPDDDIQNAAGVSFYEHLFDERWMRPLVISWINGTIVREYARLRELRLSPDDLDEVRQLLRRRGSLSASSVSVELADPNAERVSGRA
jgi:hypothetical protein